MEQFKTSWRRAGYTAFKIGLSVGDAVLVPEADRDGWLQGYGRAEGNIARDAGKVEADNPYPDTPRGEGWLFGLSEVVTVQLNGDTYG